MKTNGGFLVTKIKQLGDRIFEKILSEKNIDAFNGAQGRILYVLWQEDGISIRSLSVKCGLAITSLTTMLERMENQGLIRRVIKKACVKRLEKAYGISYFEETAAKHQIQFAIHKDIATIYLDTSGVGLHKRGYRRNSNDAPIKETLAAGIVDLARVRADSVVVDPMCGSGTFLIESAYKALKVAPGLRRNFAAEQWSQIPETAWRNARAEAMDAIDRQGAFKAFGFDVDDIAVELTRNNAKKAGVGSKLTVKQQDISKYSQIEGSITIVNPPYGERMLEIKEAEELYKKMGQRLCPSKENPCYIISPHEEFEVFFGKKADKKRKLYNGMIKCNLYMYFK